MGRTLFGRKDLPQEEPSAPEGEEPEDSDEQGGSADDVGLVADGEEEEEAPRNDDIEPDQPLEQPRLSNSILEVQIPRHISIAEPLAKPGRKKRKNIYDVSDDDEESTDDPQPVQKKRKAVKPVSKLPIGGRLTRATTATTQSEEIDAPDAKIRAAKASKKGKRKEVQTEEDPAQSNVSTALKRFKGEAIHAVQAARGPSAAPRKRGRPPKKTTKQQKPSVEDERQSSVEEPINLGDLEDILAPQEPFRNEDNVEGISDIVMGQSPAKNRPPPTRGHYARLVAKSKPSEGSLKSTGRFRLPTMSDDGDIPESSEGSERQCAGGDVGGNTRDQIEEEGQDEDEEEALQLDSEPLVAVDFFKKMLATADRVGYSYADGEERLLLKEVDREIATKSGKRMSTKLSHLKDAYQDLGATRVSGNEDELNDAQARINKCIEGLEDEVLSILETRFKNPEPANGSEYDSPKRTKNILRDVYFTIIPEFIEVLMASAHLNPLQKSMSTSAVEDIRDLVDAFYLVVNTACNLPPSHQPSAKDLAGQYGTKTFQIQQPAISLKPSIRKIRSILRLELEERNHARELERIEAQRLESERKRHEQERRDKLEHRRKVRENHRLQRAAYEEHKLWSDPLWAPIVKRNIQEDDLKRLTASQSSNYPRSTNSSSQQRQNGYHDGNRDDRDFTHDDDVYENEERVRGVFPSHNSNDRSRPWSKPERMTFMELMQKFQGMRPSCYLTIPFATLG